MDFQRQDLVEATDFANSCYIAGTIAQSGNISQLYPAITATDYIHSRFPEVAHQLLSTLPVGRILSGNILRSMHFCFPHQSSFSVETALLI